MKTPRARIAPAAFAVETSTNAKVGAVSATYASQASCPDCPLREAGCYAERGPLAYLTRRLAASPAASPAAIARAEARAIDGLTGDRPLRLHVVGDCRTQAAAKIVSAACARYSASGGRPAWTYTHAWRAVPRPAWGEVSVLASCETPWQAERAMAKGYAAALVVDRYRSESAYDLGGLRVVPCPYQTRGVTCRECRLCWDDRRLLERRLVIGFEAHGSGAALVRMSLPVIAPNQKESA